MSVHVQSYFSEALFKEVPNLRAYARMMTNDAARADIEVEETLKRAISIMDRMSRRTDLRVQLLTILRSFLIASERRHRRDFSGRSAIYDRFNRPFLAVSGDPEGPLSFASALVCLDYEDREAIVLTKAMMLTAKEAAAIIGCEAEVYRARVARGLARVAELIPGERPANRPCDAARGQAFPAIQMAANDMTPPNQF